MPEIERSTLLVEGQTMLMSCIIFWRGTSSTGPCIRITQENLGVLSRPGGRLRSDDGHAQ